MPDSVSCTGVAVTKYLIVTNDHCVPTLKIGDATTFRIAAGQDVEAELLPSEAELPLEAPASFVPWTANWR